jgi:hypothetical protein
MSILSLLNELSTAGSPLVITPAQYQELCIEIFDLGSHAADYDELILNYTFNNTPVEVKDPIEE